MSILGPWVESAYYYRLKDSKDISPPPSLPISCHPPNTLRESTLNWLICRLLQAQSARCFSRLTYTKSEANFSPPILSKVSLKLPGTWGLIHVLMHMPSLPCSVRMPSIVFAYLAYLAPGFGQYLVSELRPPVTTISVCLPTPEQSCRRVAASSYES